LSRDFAIICTSRSEMSTEAFREQITSDIKNFATSEFEPELWDWFRKRIYYISGDVKSPESYQRMKALIEQADREHSAHGNYFFYLATSPDFFGEIVRQLGAAGLTKEENGQWRRVIIEKPFGHDLESARALNIDLKKTLDERQIYRIDHYLGKETVQ